MLGPLARSKKDAAEWQRRQFRPTEPRGRWILFSAVPLTALVVYLTLVAPQRIPVPEGASVPFPKLTEFLESVCAFCSDCPFVPIAIGLGLLVVPGFFVGDAARYHVRLGVVAALAFVIAYLSISTPFDRLSQAVDNALPADNRVPSHHRAKKQ